MTLLSMLQVCCFSVVAAGTYGRHTETTTASASRCPEKLLTMGLLEVKNNNDNDNVPCSCAGTELKSFFVLLLHPGGSKIAASSHFENRTNQKVSRQLCRSYMEHLRLRGKPDLRAGASLLRAILPFTRYHRIRFGVTPGTLSHALH